MSDQDTYGDSPAPYSLEFSLNLARLWRAGKLIGGDPYSVVNALLEEVEKQQPITGGDGQKNPLGPATPMPSAIAAHVQDDELLVNFGDMRDFTLASLKQIMGNVVDTNHQAMVEEHLKAFNYAVTQGIHPGQVLFALVQAFAMLQGFAIRSGLRPEVAGQMMAFVMKQSRMSARDVQIAFSH